MGTREVVTSTKNIKPHTEQEHPSVPSYPEWAAAFQAYYGPGTSQPQPGYFPAAVASSPQPHPYMWGGQPPLMVPYGTPAHAAMYPYGGIYAHPALAAGAHPYGPYAMPSPCTELAMAAATTDIEGKSSEAKEHTPSKRSKEGLGTLGMITGTGNEGVKGTSGSANGHSQSGDSATEGSSEGSEEDFPQNGSSKFSLNQHSTDGTHGSAGLAAYTGQPGDLGVSPLGHALTNPLNAAIATGKAPAGLTTNLNIGMDFWSANTPVSAKGKHSSAGMSTSLIVVPSNSQPREGMSGDQWLQDDRELKRQRRKQSNRESARRSRLRKQAECEDLSTRVDNLTAENSALRTELNRLAEDCKKLSSDNAALLEKLQIRHSQNPGTRQEQDVMVEKQHMQPEQKASDQKRKYGSHYAVKNDVRILERFDSAASILPMRGHSDVTAAG